MIRFLLWRLSWCCYCHFARFLTSSACNVILCFVILCIVSYCSPESSLKTLWEPSETFWKRNCPINYHQESLKLHKKSLLQIQFFLILISIFKCKQSYRWLIACYSVLVIIGFLYWSCSHASELRSHQSLNNLVSFFK